MSNVFEKEIFQPATVHYLEGLGYSCVREYPIFRKKLDIFATSPKLGNAFIECKINSVSMKSHVKQILGYWSLYCRAVELNYLPSLTPTPLLMLAFPASTKISKKEQEVCDRNNVSIVRIEVEIELDKPVTLRLSSDGIKALEAIQKHLKSSVPQGVTVSRNEAVEFSILEAVKHLKEVKRGDNC